MINSIMNNVAGLGAEQTVHKLAPHGPGEANPADQARFEAALNGPPETTAGDAPPAAVQSEPATRNETTLGDAVLDQIEAFKTRCDAAREGVNQRLAALQDGEFSVADVIRLQQDLAAFNLQATFTSKVAEEVNQGIQTMMKSQ